MKEELGSFQENNTCTLVDAAPWRKVGLQAETRTKRKKSLGIRLDGLLKVTRNVKELTTPKPSIV